MYGKEYLEEMEIREIMRKLDSSVEAIQDEYEQTMFQEAWNRFRKKNAFVMKDFEVLKDPRPGALLPYDNDLLRQAQGAINNSQNLGRIFGGIFG